MFATHLRLLSFLGPYKKRVILAWIAVLATAIFTMVMPQLLAYSIDTGLKPPTFADSGAELAEDISSTDTQVILTDPADIEAGEKIRLGGEQLQVTSASGNTLTVERGAEDSRIASHDAGRKVEIVDRPSYEGKVSTLTIAAGLLMLAALLRGISTYGMQFSGEWLSQHVAYDLRNHIYEKLQRLSYAYHDNQQTGRGGDPYVHPARRFAADGHLAAHRRGRGPDVQR